MESKSEEVTEERGKDEKNRYANQRVVFKREFPSLRTILLMPRIFTRKRNEKRKSLDNEKRKDGHGKSDEKDIDNFAC